MSISELGFIMKKESKIIQPVLPLRDIVVFPNMIVRLFVGREKSVKALEEVMKDNKEILLVSQVDAGPISGDVNKFILQDIEGTFDEFPGTLLTGPDGIANADSRDATKSFDTATGKTVNIGGAKAGPLRALAAKIATDPFTGKTLKVPMEARLVTSKGESTYKDLSTGKRDNDLTDLTDLDL